MSWALRGGCGVVGANSARLRNVNHFWRWPFLRLCFVAPPLKTEPAGAGLRFWRRDARAFAGDMKLVSHHIPGAGSLDLQLPSVGKLHRSFPAVSLESAAFIVRARGLRAIIKEKLIFAKMGLVISKQIGYTVCSEITKRLFPACCNRRFGNGRFLIAGSIRWCFAPSMPSNSPS